MLSSIGLHNQRAATRFEPRTRRENAGWPISERECKLEGVRC
jgi:hypothetical protein